MKEAKNTVRNLNIVVKVKGLTARLMLFNTAGGMGVLLAMYLYARICAFS